MVDWPGVWPMIDGGLSAVAIVSLPSSGTLERHIGGGMFGSHVIDVGIGLAMFFLFVSLICSAVREAFESVLKSRARDLERGLRMLLDDPNGQGLTASLFQHGQIASLMEGEYDPDKLKKALFGAFHMPAGAGRSALPSYIPAEQFATALMDIVARGGGGAPPEDADAPLSLDMLRSRIPLIPSAQVQRAVLTAVDHASNDLNRARQNLETWFNGSMDRVSGWYKRRTQVWLFCIGVLAAVVLNLDALTILKRLQIDDTFRQAVVASAQTVIDQGGVKSLGQPPEKARDALETAGYPIGWRMSAKGYAVPTQFCAAPSGDCTLAQVEGWRRAGTILLLLVGWLITGAAATFGAPFWFDVLNKFMVVRSTVKPAQKSGTEASADPISRGASGDAAGATQAAAAPSPSSAGGPSPSPPPFQPETWRPGFVNAGELDL